MFNKFYYTLILATVFKILSQLRRGLADSSKPVADHMTALLSHSMADMYFSQSHQVYFPKGGVRITKIVGGPKREKSLVAASYGI